MNMNRRALMLRTLSGLAFYPFAGLTSLAPAWAPPVMPSKPFHKPARSACRC